MDPAVTLESFEIVMSVLALVLTGIGTLAGVVYFLINGFKNADERMEDKLTQSFKTLEEKTTSGRQVLEERLTDRLSILEKKLSENIVAVHDKIDQKTRHLDDKIDKRANALSSGLDKVEDRARVDIQEQRSRVDTLINK